jgi:hypothetical protein
MRPARAGLPDGKCAFATRKTAIPAELGQAGRFGGRALLPHRRGSPGKDLLPAARRAALDSLFVGDQHVSPTPYYQNTPMLGRLLAEWGEAPAGWLFLLPLWHLNLDARAAADSEVDLVKTIDSRPRNAPCPPPHRNPRRRFGGLRAPDVGG